jgi:hypothetical protein
MADVTEKAKQLVNFIADKAKELQCTPDDVICSTAWVFCKAVAAIPLVGKHIDQDERFMKVMKSRMLGQIKQFRTKQDARDRKN